MNNIGKKPKLKKICLGWREWVSLPDLGVEAIKAKVDSGARTSALHVLSVKIKKRKNKEFVYFKIHPVQKSSVPEISAKAEHLGYRTVKSSVGHTTLRPVIKTTLVIGEKEIPIELTLVNRDLMGFRMLIGRQAIRRGFIVNPGKSYLTKK